MKDERDDVAGDEDVGYDAWVEAGDRVVGVRDTKQWCQTRKQETVRLNLQLGELDVYRSAEENRRNSDRHCLGSVS